MLRSAAAETIYLLVVSHGFGGLGEHNKWKTARHCTLLSNMLIARSVHIHISFHSIWPWFSREVVFFLVDYKAANHSWGGDYCLFCPRSTFRTKLLRAGSSQSAPSPGPKITIIARITIKIRIGALLRRRLILARAARLKLRINCRRSRCKIACQII